MSGAPHDGIVVYGTGWCPDVRRARAVLDAAGLDYAYIDVETDRRAARAVRRLQNGSRRVPTLVWPDGTFVVEPDDEELQARVNRPE